MIHLFLSADSTFVTDLVTSLAHRLYIIGWDPHHISLDHRDFSYSMTFHETGYCCPDYSFQNIIL